MRAAIEFWLTRRWYGGVAPGWGLRLAARLYQALLGSRGSPVIVKIAVPVLVIGNFTAGGTGKTPLVIALARHFSARGFRPGIVSRGHGRRFGAPLQVSAQTLVRLSGDEPRLMFEKTGLPVLVDRDRVAAARAAVAAGCDLIIADDGLQHRRLGRDVEIEVLDGQRGYGNGMLLPAGPLRETPKSCDFRVVNGETGAAGDWPMRLRLSDAVSLADPADRCPIGRFAGSPAHAVAAIGNPSRFFNALRALGLDPVEHVFEDHHEYQARDFSGMEGPILMTEKDAVKCRLLGLTQAWVVPVEAELPAEFFAAVEHSLKRAHARS